jgi:hypothetical protein
MTRTLEARRPATVAPLGQLPRVSATPMEAAMLRDMAMVMKLTAKMSCEIRRDHADKKA